MLRNYFKTAWRYLLKYKVPASINISGLAIGIGCFVLIGLYISDEISYDRKSPDAARIFRIATNFVNEAGFEDPEATTPPALSVAIKRDIPEVEAITRLFIVNDHSFYVRSGDNKFFEQNIYHADTSFFNFFNVKLIKGDARTALIYPDAIVISSSIAKKYFGHDDPIGKTLEIDDWGAKTVSGVMEDIPVNSHFKIDIIAPLRRFMETNADNDWRWFNFYTYVKLAPGARPDTFVEKINAVYRNHQPGSKSSFFCQPLTDIHLTSHLKYELMPNSDILYVYIFGTVGILVLLVACINYINLTTSFSFFRTKEIGIRKINGASRKSLIIQFIIESILISFIATLLAILIASLCLPVINQVTGKHLQFIQNSGWLTIGYILLAGILTGGLSGLYPAFYLSSFAPIKILKDKMRVAPANINIRRIFAVAQFTISVALIFGMIVIAKQVQFMQDIKLGLNKDNVIIVNDLFTLSENQRNALKNEWRKVEGVEQVASADGVIGNLNWVRDVRYKGSINSQRINFLSVDSDFIKVLQIELKEGRNLSAYSAVDSTGEVILNETGVRELGIPEPVVGSKILWNVNANTGQTYYATIVGVAKDFHFASMKDKIKPFAFVVNPGRAWNYTIRLNGANMSHPLADIKRIWDENVKEFPFKYVFLNDTFSRFYRSEADFKTVFRYITIAVIFISCMGLFGLSFLIIHQRNKEIGIRKVLGASATSIATMLSKDFFKMIIMASLIAFPVAWWAARFWLRDFTYRVDIDIWVFLIAELAALFLVAVTIGVQAIRAALANPVKALRSE